MRQTEIETEEKEVERVYCDECGSDCTGTYKLVAQEVCGSCSSDFTLKWKAEEILRREVTNRMNKPDDMATLIVALSVVIAFPGFIIFIIMEATDSEAKKADAQFMAICILGVLLWAGVAVFLAAVF